VWIWLRFQGYQAFAHCSQANQPCWISFLEKLVHINRTATWATILDGYICVKFLHLLFLT
jgi:hypothetical protein